jgi:hypothetical protein
MKAAALRAEEIKAWSARVEQREDDGSRTHERSPTIQCG